MSSVTNDIRNTAKQKLSKLIHKSTLNNKNVTKSRQRLVSESSSSDVSIGNNKEEIIEASVHQADKNYIMDKFLKTTSIDEDDSSKVKAPVPRPRTKKLDEEKGLSDNSGTYTIISPEHVNKLQNKYEEKLMNSPGSGNTYTKSISENTSAKESVEMVEFKNEKNCGLDEEIQEEENELLQVFANETINEDGYNYKKLINIIIHSSNRLELESCVIHPVVKIHVIDTSTGNYLKKSDKNRKVLFYYENENIDYIGPILTKSYNLQENRSIYPKWEESILLNEDFIYFQENHNIILFFEIMDFLSFNQVNQENTGGWKNIAWAFLFPNAPNFTNTNKKVRLQLYRPRRISLKDTCSVYNWWKNKKFQKYPSTLYVTVESIEAPTKIVETFRSKTPLESETTKNKIITSSKSILKPEDDEEIWKFSSDVNKVCKVPNSLLVKLDTYLNGSYCIKFSNSGKFLACALSDEDDFIILIYSILENTDLINLNGHQALIYNIVWSKDDNILISASADSKVCVWDAINFILLQILAHPNFVYCCDISHNTIVTGCYDTNIRIWALNQDEEFKLYAEYEGHKSYITSTCFNKQGNIFYSSDSVGTILGWKIKNDKWDIRRTIQILDLKDTIIDQIILLKNERRLIINSRDNFLRLIDIKTEFVLKVYAGALNNRYHTTCCLTPCETYLITGSENGEVHMWSTDTGKILHIFRPFEVDVTIHCVHYSNVSNLLAISHYGNNNLPVLIYHHIEELTNKINDDKNIPIINKLNIKPNIKTSYNEHGPNFKKILEKMDDIISQSSLSK